MFPTAATLLNEIILRIAAAATPSPSAPPPLAPGMGGAATANPNIEVWGMPLPAALAIIALLSAVLTALVTGAVKKFRTPVDDREDRVVVFDASDRLLQRFEKALADSDEKHGKEIKTLADEVEELKLEVEKMRRERFSLISALMKIAQIARKYGGAEAAAEIDNIEMPDGVTIQ